MENRRTVEVSIKHVYADSLEIGGYQRNYDAKRVKRLVKEFNLALVDVPTIAVRPDGSMWVVDGQHTLGLLMDVGYERFTCVLFDSKGREDEAPVYLAANGTGKGRGKPVSPYDRYRAGLSFGDKVAMEMKSIFDSVEVEIADCHGSDKKRTNAIGTIEDMVRGGRSEALIRGVNFIKATWNNQDDNAWSADLIRGCSDFVNRLTALQEYAASKRLAKKSCIGIIGRAEVIAKALGKHKRNCVADVLAADAKVIDKAA
ncbi:MAG: DUF6551 family protein [Methylobacter sp.]